MRGFYEKTQSSEHFHRMPYSFDRVAQQRLCQSGGESPAGLSRSTAVPSAAAVGNYLYFSAIFGYKARQQLEILRIGDQRERHNGELERWGGRGRRNNNG